MRHRSLAVLLFAAVLLAGCGGTYATAGSSPSAATAKTSGAAKVHAARSSLGTIMATSQGRTLYVFMHDRGTTSRCYGACATNWPPLMTHGAPVAGTGARSGLLVMTHRRTGGTQVTYAGHPVYRFAGDTAAGQTRGDGITAFGGTWHAVSPAGARPKKTTGPTAPPPTTSTPKAPSPYGY